ncbi:MAG: T9SS type A sorting domain-containing protein, partial [Saprospiraceae bacterium]|nr:T9SS type A sorting domain-containing protein [Saprospiraceae bacterium]
LNWETLESTPYKGWLFCLSSDGKLKWERFYKNPKNLDEGVNIFRKLVICDDGGILVGTEGSDVKNKSGLWLLKLDSMGCLTPDCAGTELYTSVKDEKGNWKDIKEIFFSMYPNPAKEVVNIDFFSPQPGRKMELMVSDMNGVGLYRTEINNEKHIEQINVSGYKPGSYVVSLLMNGKVIQSEGMVKE